MTEISLELMMHAERLYDEGGYKTVPTIIAEAILSERLRNAEIKEEVRKVLEPFAKAGKVIDGPFGPALFAEDDMAFQSGCAWSENGVRRTITWGDFRAARALLSKLEGL